MYYLLNNEVLDMGKPCHKAFFVLWSISEKLFPKDFRYSI